MDKNTIKTVKATTWKHLKAGAVHDNWNTVGRSGGLAHRVAL